MDAYLESIRRDVRTAETKVDGCTVRRHYEGGAFIGATVYNPSGWKVAMPKTERGIASAVARAAAAHREEPKP